MVNRRGINLSIFENESETGAISIYKLKETKNLRLYFIVVDCVTLIIGGGSVKNVTKWQDDEKLTQIINRIKIISKFIDENNIKIDKTNYSEFLIELDN